MKWCLSHLVRLLLHKHETVANTMGITLLWDGVITLLVLSGN